jgi:PAS domain S-box-containing protein
MSARARALRGYGDEPLNLERLFAAVHAEDRDALRRSLQQAASDGGQIEREYRVIRPDGEMRWISLHANAARDPEDGRVHVQGVSIDVTPRKLADIEARRRQAEIAHLSRVTMLGELSGAVAHELNQPLTAILSNAQAALRLLDQEDRPLGEVREILSDIVQEDRRAGEVIRRLRVLLKKGEVQLDPVELRSVVDDVLKLLRSDLLSQGVIVTTELADRLPRVLGDEVQIEQVLVNLVANACDAMAAKDSGARCVRLSADLEDSGAVRVSVADTGCGLPAEDLERVFEPFVTTKTQGMGLGLTVCRTIVGAHGGRLWAVNNEGGGATFHFTLPVFETR